MPGKKNATEVVETTNDQARTTISTMPILSTILPITTKVDEVETTTITSEAEISSNTNRLISTDKDSGEQSIDQQPSITPSLSDNEPNNNKNKKDGELNKGRISKYDITIQNWFFDRIIREKLEVTVELGKVTLKGVVIHNYPYLIILNSNGSSMQIQKGAISMITAKKTFSKPFVKRDRSFSKTSENPISQYTDEPTIQVTAQPTEPALEATKPEFNDKEKPSSQMQTARDRVENKQKPSPQTSISQTVKPDTDKSSFSSNKPIAEKAQSDYLSQRPLTQGSRTSQTSQVSKVTTSSKSDISTQKPNSQQNQAGKNEPNKTVKVFRVSSIPTNKPKK